MIGGEKRISLKEIHIKGLFGRAPAPSKTAPALASLVERLL